MAKRYDLEHCVRVYKGQETNTPYLDQFSPTLVTAEELANKLGLDAVMGVKFVETTFTPYETDGVEEPELAPELIALAAVEAAVANLPEKESAAILDAVAQARTALGFDTVDTEVLVLEGDQEKPVVEEAPVVKGKK